MHEKIEFVYSLFTENYALPLTKKACETKEQILLSATLAFAERGYAAVSMRDLARLMGINQSTIYSHFESKEALWIEVIDHASHLYLLYFDHLDKKLGTCSSFEDVLEAIFYHPKHLLNIFSCYAYSLLQTEQFRDHHAGKMYEEVFLTYAVAFLRKRLDKCIARGLVGEFNTETVAVIIVHGMLMGLQTEVHRLLNHGNMSPYDPRKMIQGIQDFVGWAVRDREVGECEVYAPSGAMP